MYILNVVNAVVSFFVMIYMYIFYLPKLELIYRNFGAGLPRETEFALYISRFIGSYFYLLSISICVIIYLIYKLKYERLRYVPLCVGVICMMLICVALIGMDAATTELEKAAK